ncbi:MAG: LacI family DNA-binding transcriptional regulator [Chitinophagaceae bacterium]|nr:LacI family DNA-binding transcriptional regulator [Chitinophagaceae bacterium]
MKPKKDVTIYDIAQKLSLSSATVSRGLKDHPAINKNTRKKNTGSGAGVGIQAQQFRQQSPQTKEQYHRHYPP